MNTPIKALLIFVNEADRWHGEQPLYEALIERLRQLDVAGATAMTGIMGFGHHHRVHHKGLFGIADDRPVTIMVLDDERKLRAALPELRPMVKEGLMVLLEAELIADSGSDGHVGGAAVL